MFVGRHQELAQLNQAYQENNFQFVVIYGRRGIGKTSLINQFLKDKKAIYYVAFEENTEDTLKHLSNAINFLKVLIKMKSLMTLKNASKRLHVWRKSNVWF